MSIDNLEEKAKQLRREYQREYYKRNREKRLQSVKDYWIKRAKELVDHENDQ